MSEHVVDVSWSRGEHEFTDPSYSRDHTWTFDGGDTVTALANPAHLGSEAAVDPEEAFVAALASCHMLTFLAIAARSGSSSTPTMITRSASWPRTRRAGWRSPRSRYRRGSSSRAPPDAATLDQMHHLSHDQCFIANSVTPQVTVLPS
jgi:organic hydroperoxide reductase OsmC/OhrA